MASSQPTMNINMPMEALSFTASCRQAWATASHSMSDPLVQQQALEGASLRAAAAFVAYPLDVLKTQVQAGHPRYCNLRAAPRLIGDYHSAIFRGYPGVGGNAFMMGALMFGGYRFFDNFWRLQGVPDYWRPAVAGASIGGICGLVSTPLEQVKTVMALQESWVREGKISERIFRSVPHGALSGSWRLKLYAAAPLMCRTALFDCQLFFYNSRLREYLATHGHTHSDATRTFLGTFGFMLAGLCGATINYPFDLVKGRMMAEAYFAHSGEMQKMSTVGTFAKVVRDGGLASLFRGLPTRSALHAMVWCVVGIGREVCERSGVRDVAKARSASQGHSKQLSA
mmetsp:Transcript_120118/g.347039  ORF Transcript_120118/g.347039 Transcript_120118/m.347039 type:complete len:341 (-) Transcript_120118:216-1238(-)